VKGSDEFDVDGFCPRHGAYDIHLQRLKKITETQK